MTLLKVTKVEIPAKRHSGVWIAHLFLINFHKAIVQPELCQAVVAVRVVATTACCTALCYLILMMWEHLQFESVTCKTVNVPGKRASLQESGAQMHG